MHENQQNKIKFRDRSQINHIEKTLSWNGLIWKRIK